MSKKLEALKKAVFYSAEKPEILAGILAEGIADVASKVELSGSDSIAIPEGETATTATYTATVTSQFGDEMSGTVTFSLKSAVTGVSVDSSTGVVSVDNTTTDNECIVVATCGSASAEKTVALIPTN